MKVIPTVNLKGSTQPSGRMISCHRCRSRCPAEGSLEVSPGVMRCAACWAHRKNRERVQPVLGSPTFGQRAAR